jgi:dihydroorotase
MSERAAFNEGVITVSATLVIRNGRLLDPGIGLDAASDLLAVDGKIASHEARSSPADIEFDATGLLVVPGLIDVHVHLRQPGKEQAETVASGSAAALAGGFTTILAMPNTSPPIDNPATVQNVKRLADEAGGARVEIAACVTDGRQGKILADLRSLASAGVAGFSDDGSGVADTTLMWRAMQVARECDLPILDHCENATLSGDGVINAGHVAELLGVPGISAESETVMVLRDLALARVTGCRIHVQHVSTAFAVELIRAAKKAGIAVTAEATPHHLTLTEEALRDGDANYKMNPPLRTAEDVAAVRAGLKDGTIDCIASDHAPHAAEDKGAGLAQAPFGVIGLETTLPILWTELVETGEFTAAEIISRMTACPAQILRLPVGTLRVGAPADITLIDPNCSWRIDPQRFRSKSRNCPFNGREVKAKAVAVVVGGRLFCEEAPDRITKAADHSAFRSPHSEFREGGA